MLMHRFSASDTHPTKWPRSRRVPLLCEQWMARLRQDAGSYWESQTLRRRFGVVRIRRIRIEIFGFHRLAHGVGSVQPAPQVDEFAALAAKGSKRSVLAPRDGDRLPAGRAFVRRHENAPQVVGVAVVDDVASLEPVLAPPSPVDAGLLSDVAFPSDDSFSLLADCL